MPQGPTWTIGDVKVTSIIEMDQHWRFAWLLPEVDEAAVAEHPWLTPNFVDDKGKMVLRIQSLVVESQGQRIMVDTCVGNDKPRPTPLFDKLQTTFFEDLVAGGFAPDSIDQVICTHMHVDHVGWNTKLVDGAWVPTFPRARYLFARTEFDHWMNTDDTSVYGDVMGDSVRPIVETGLSILVDSDHHLTEEVFLEPTPGHTPGHVSIRIRSAGQDAVITGDMIHHPIQFPRPELTSDADTSNEGAVATRRAAFDRWCQAGILVIGTHFAGPGAGRLVAESGAWRFDC